MFGYVRPFVPELKVAQYEAYRAVYCGLCRAMGHTTGQLSRLTLSYDLVLLAAVRMVLGGIPYEASPHRCPAHPAKRRMIAEPNPALDYAAAFSAVLAEAKNRDDRTDEHGAARLKPILLTPAVRHMAHLADRHLPPEAAAETARCLDGLAELERQNCPSADETADRFGDLLAAAFSLGLEGEAARTAETIGRGVGRFTYLCDAADDMEEDARRKRYNPLLVGWGELALTDGKRSALVGDSLRVSVPLSLEEAGRAADSLDAEHPLTPVIRNIIYLGLPAALHRVLGDGKKEAEERTEKGNA